MGDFSGFSNVIDCQTVSVGGATYRVQSSLKSQRARREEAAKVPTEPAAGFEDHDDEPSCVHMGGQGEGGGPGGGALQKGSTPRPQQPPNFGTKPGPGGGGKQAPNLGTKPGPGGGGQQPPNLGTKPGPGGGGQHAPNLGTKPGAGGGGQQPPNNETKPGQGGGNQQAPIKSVDGSPGSRGSQDRRTWQDSSFSVNVSCDSRLFSILIGPQGSTRKRIESSAQVHMRVPRQWEDGDIIITGASQEAVDRGQALVLETVKSAQQDKRIAYNYFVSLPLKLPADKADKLASMKNEVLADRPAAAQLGIDDVLFSQPERMHLTLMMLKLHSKDQREAAAKVLEELGPKMSGVLNGRPLQLQLKGLGYFAINDDPAQMNVLYLEPKEVGDGRLVETLAGMAVEAFGAAGLLTDEDMGKKPRLHATLMNASNRRIKPGANSRPPFDGRELLQRYSSLDLGVIDLREMHVSTRGDFDETGFYRPLATVATK